MLRSRDYNYSDHNKNFDDDKGILIECVSFDMFIRPVRPLKDFFDCQPIKGMI